MQELAHLAQVLHGVPSTPGWLVVDRWRRKAGQPQTVHYTVEDAASGMNPDLSTTACPRS